MIPNVSQLGAVGQAVTTATTALAPIWAFTSSILILLILMGALFLFARYVGRGPFVSLIAALYIAYGLYAAFPYTSYLPTAPALTAVATQVALYLVFFVISFIILRRISASDFIHIGTIGLTVISFVTAGFILMLAYQSFQVREVYHFSTNLDALFAAKEWFFAWFVAPLIGLFIFAR